MSHPTSFPTFFFFFLPGETKSDFGAELDVLQKSDDITTGSLLSSFPEEAPLSLLNGGSGVAPDWSPHLKVPLDDLGVAVAVGENNSNVTNASATPTSTSTSPTRIVVTAPAVKSHLSSPQKMTQVVTATAPVATLATAKMIATTPTPGVKSLRILPIATYRLSTTPSSMKTSAKKELITWPGNVTLFYSKQQAASASPLSSQVASAGGTSPLAFFISFSFA